MAKSDAADHVINAVGLANAFAALRAAAPEVVADTQKPDVYKELMARHLDKAIAILREKGMTPEFAAMLEAATTECKGLTQAAAVEPPAAVAPPSANPDEPEEPEKSATETPPDAAATEPLTIQSQNATAEPTAKAKLDPWAWTYAADLNSLLKNVAGS
jgi:hypothetical protein